MEISKKAREAIEDIASGHQARQVEQDHWPGGEGTTVG